MLGRSRYSTKTPIVLHGSEGFSLDNSSAQVFCLWEICLIVAFSKLFHIYLTRLWYLASRESLTSYSPRICRAINCESVKSIIFFARIFLASLQRDIKALYSITLLVTKNLNLMDYLNSSFSNLTRRIPALPLSCAKKAVHIDRPLVPIFSF